MSGSDFPGARCAMEPVTCEICHDPISPLDVVIYIRAEKVLMHRRCCDAHPSCHCPSSETNSIDADEVCTPPLVAR